VGYFVQKFDKGRREFIKTKHRADRERDIYRAVESRLKLEDEGSVETSNDMLWGILRAGGYSEAQWLPSTAVTLQKLYVLHSPYTDVSTGPQNE
jgi:hypothetical protein